MANIPYFPEGGKITLGVEEVGMIVSSGRASHSAENKERAASVTDWSRDLGMNILIRVLRFSRKVVVFSMAAAVERRLREAILSGIRYALEVSVSWGPDTWRLECGNGSLQVLVLSFLPLTLL